MLARYLSVYHLTHVLPFSLFVKEWNINPLQTPMQRYGEKKKEKATFIVFNKLL